MRFIISLLLLPFFALTACAQGTSGVSIPAGQTFVLGEYRTDGYRATLRNQGSQTITAAIVNQKDGKTVSTVNLPAGDRQALTIADGQEVHLINGSDQIASVKVKSPVKGSQGMRYVKADNDKANTDFEANKKVALLFPTVEADEDTSSGATSGKFTLAPGERLIVGEGSSKHYNLIISNRGSSLSVSGRNKINDERMQSFGLGRFGKVNMAIRPNENLVIVNNSEKASTVKLTMDKPVVGARVE